MNTRSRLDIKIGEKRSGNKRGVESHRRTSTIPIKRRSHRGGERKGLIWDNGRLTKNSEILSHKKNGEWGPRAT